MRQVARVRSRENVKQEESCHARAGRVVNGKQDMEEESKPQQQEAISALQWF